MPHSIMRRLRGEANLSDGAGWAGQGLAKEFSSAKDTESPTSLESQVSELTVSTEISKMNKSFSIMSNLSDMDIKEIDNLRKIELQKMPFHRRVAERAAELLGIILAFFTGKHSNKHSLTPTARKAITQLRQLAALYAAMPHKSLEQTIVFDSAFGKAYYDILSSSYKSNTRGEANSSREVSQYQRAIDGFIEALG